MYLGGVVYPKYENKFYKPIFAWAYFSGALMFVYHFYNLFFSGFIAVIAYRHSLLEALQKKPVSTLEEWQNLQERIQIRGSLFAMNGGIKFFVEFVCAIWVPYGIYLMCVRDVSVYTNLLFNYIILMLNMGLIALTWYFQVINLMAYTCGCVGEKSFSEFFKFIPGLKLGVNGEEMIQDGQKTCWQKFTGFVAECDDLSVHNDEDNDYSIINKNINERLIQGGRSSTSIKAGDEDKEKLLGSDDVEETQS